GGTGGPGFLALARRAAARGTGAGRIARGTGAAIGAGAGAVKPLLRWAGLVLLAGVALQLFFVLRIAMMTAVDPQSTTFQRSEAWRVATERDKFRWRQQ